MRPVVPASQRPGNGSPRTRVPVPRVAGARMLFSLFDVFCYACDIGLQKLHLIIKSRTIYQCKKTKAHNTP